MGLKPSADKTPLTYRRYFLSLEAKAEYLRWTRAVEALNSFSLD